MADAVISLVIQSLASGVIKEIMSQTEFSKELRKLKEGISTVKKFIAHAEEERRLNDAVGQWLEKLEDALFDAYDLMDEIRDDHIMRSPPGLVEKVCVPFSLLHQIFHPMTFGQRLMEVRKDLDEVIGKKPEQVKERPGERTVKSLPVLAKGNEIIGRVGDKIRVKQLLLGSSSSESEDESVSVISIVGDRGVGKTELALHLFVDDEEVRYHFNLRVWISASQVSGLMTIVWRIIESANQGQSLEACDMDQLVSILRKTIAGKRYLIVLDDVKNEEWRQLPKFLGSGGAKGSRVLVTTRSDPGLTQAIETSYRLEGLGPDASWSLFKKFAFKHAQEPKNERRLIGERILRMCEGNPLVIKTVGYILRSKPTVEEWTSFENNQFSGIARLGNWIPKILRLKYDNFPRHLRSCFAYCAVFPEDYEIDVKTLINLWIAQGFIIPSSQSHPDKEGLANSEKTESLEDLGYGYFHDLYSGGFFRQKETDEDGEVTRCEIPNHDLAMSVAGERCLTWPSKKEIDTKTRHVSFHSHLGGPWQVPSSLYQAKRIQTILLPSQLRWGTEGTPGKSICGKILSSCRFLRVLDMHNLGIGTLPSSIDKLRHLRYLDLSHNIALRTLPNSITKLRHLHTLKLSYCSRLEGLPRDTRNLVNLRHLEIEGCHSFTDMPPGLGRLTNLRTLSEFVLSKVSSSNLSTPQSEFAANGSTNLSRGLDALRELNNLHGQLLIKNLKHGEDCKAANLKSKQYLRSLVLIWDAVDATAVKVADCRQGIECSSNAATTAGDYLVSLEDLEPHKAIKELSLSAYRGVRFPDWFASLENLVTVSLWRCMNCQYLPPLDMFPRLKVLVLGQLTSLKYLVDNVKDKSSSAVLSSLKEIQLIELPKLEQWWRQEKVEGDDDDGGSCSTTTASRMVGSRPPSFSSLSKLVIENCPKLISMPLFPRLKELLELNNSSWKPFQQTMLSIIANREVPSPGGSRLFELRCLRIVGIKEADMPDGDAINWSLFEGNLRILTFDHLPQLKALPEGLEDLKSLQELHISRCNNLEKIPDWITNLTSLNKVSLRLLPSFTTLPRGMDGHASSITVEIEDCPKIAANPNPNKDLVKKYITTSEAYAKADTEEVVLNGSSYTWKQFEKAVSGISSNPSSRVPTTDTGGPGLQAQPVQALDEDSLTTHDASTNPKLIVSHFFNLCTLRIDGIKDLPSLPEWLKGLTCLKKLSIWNCPKLKYLSPGIHRFTSLKALDIYKCKELDMINDDASMWRALTSLRHVTFQELPELKHLPEGLGQLTALQKVHVLGCASLETIPEWISNLQSLQEIRIWKCPAMASIPEEIRSLASLRKLEIVDCPNLIEKMPEKNRRGLA